MHANATPVYATIDDVITAELAGVDPYLEDSRVDMQALARDLTEWVDAHNDQGQVLLNRSGFQVREQYRTDDDAPENADAFWDLVEAHTHPYAPLREQTLTRDTREGSWEVEIQWRPEYAEGVDRAADANGGTALIWEQPPVRIGVDAVTGTAVIVEHIQQVAGDIAATFEPTQITDPDADLAPGQYRVLTTTLNDEDTTLPVETAAEANAS